LASVDYVVVFSEDTPLKTIQRIKLDILVKGSDWDKGKIVGADFVSASGGSVIRIPLLQGRSTTNLIEKVAKTFSRQRR
jgi:bifunctional ADP-heptose synthase (sugar kinase/adenylyltransferase)